MVLKVIEAFSGIGSQAKALEKLSKRKLNFEYEVVATIEWEIGAMFAYDIIHNGQQDLSKYDSLTKEELSEKLAKFNISNDGKNPMPESALKRMTIEQLKAITHSIENNNNLVDISKVRAQDLPDADLLTYSFPCQDLSISSYWHGNFSGIDKGANNRSGLLWEVERILNEYDNLEKSKPRFLLMENVTAIHGPLHKKNFEYWQTELERMGYKNFTYDLSAKNFGIPQSRTRTFMISVLMDGVPINYDLKFKELFDALKVSQDELPKLDPFLKLDYSDSRYLEEAVQNIPNKTPSREDIYRTSVKLAYGSKTSNTIAKTITTKQDRNPNAGVIVHEIDSISTSKKMEYRNLTPRETFLLMGFEEGDFQQLLDNNFRISKSRKMLSHSKLLVLSGNSIVVNVLTEIFSIIDRVNTIIENKEIIEINEEREIYECMLLDVI